MALLEVKGGPHDQAGCTGGTISFHYPIRYVDLLGHASIAYYTATWDPVTNTIKDSVTSGAMFILGAAEGDPIPPKIRVVEDLTYNDGTERRHEFFVRPLANETGLEFDYDAPESGYSVYDGGTLQQSLTDITEQLEAMQAAVDQAGINPLVRQTFFHEQLTQGTTDFWGDNSSGGSRALTAPTAGQAGVIRYNLSTNTGRAVFGLLQNQLAPGAALTMTYQVMVKLVTLSDATNTWTARLGFANAFQGGDPTSAAFFRYSHGVNGGKWQAVSRAGGVETAVDTGVAASTAAFHKFKIVLTNLQALYYIDDVLVATINSNIPAVAVGMYLYAQRNVGSTSLDVLDVDWVRLDLDWSPSR